MTDETQKPQQSSLPKRTKDSVINKGKRALNTVSSFISRATELKFENFLGHATTVKITTEKSYIINHNANEDPKHIGIKINAIKPEAHKDNTKDNNLYFLSRSDYNAIKDKTLIVEGNSENLLYKYNNKVINLYKCTEILKKTDNNTEYNPYVRIDENGKATLVYIDKDNKISDLSVSNNLYEKVTRVTENHEVSISVIPDGNSNVLSKFLNIVIFGFAIKVSRAVSMVVPMVFGKIARLNLSLSNWLLKKEQNLEKDLDKESKNKSLKTKLYFTKGCKRFFGIVGIFFDTIAIALRGTIAITFNSLQCVFAYILYPIRNDDERKASVELVKKACIGLKHCLQSVGTMVTQLKNGKEMESATLSEPPASQKEDNIIYIHTNMPKKTVIDTHTTSHSKSNERKTSEQTPTIPQCTPKKEDGTGIFNKKPNKPLTRY